MCTWMRVIQHFSSSLSPSKSHTLMYSLSHSQVSQDSFFRAIWFPPPHTPQGQGVEVSILVWCQQQQTQPFHSLTVLYKFCSNPKTNNLAFDLSGNCTRLFTYMLKNKAITECFDRSRFSKPHRFKPKEQEVSSQLCCFGQQTPPLLFAPQKANFIRFRSFWTAVLLWTSTFQLMVD